MPRRSSAPAPARRGAGRAGAGAERGAITWVGVALLLLLCGGGYLAWVWGPLWVVHYEVKQVVRDYMNQAVRNKNDAELVQKMTAKLASLAEEDGVDVGGNPVRVAAVVVTPDRVTWERDADARPPTLRVAFEYDRAVVYPFLETTATATFDVDLEADLTHADWGPAR